jgi:hypothetical protein
MNFDDRLLQNNTYIFAHRAYNINERFGPCDASDITPGRAPMFIQSTPNIIFKTNKPDTPLLPIIEKILIIIILLYIIVNYLM